MAGVKQGDKRGGYKVRIKFNQPYRKISNGNISLSKEERVNAGKAKDIVEARIRAKCKVIKLGGKVK